MRDYSNLTSAEYDALTDEEFEEAFAQYAKRQETCNYNLSWGECSIPMIFSSKKGRFVSPEEYEKEK